MSTINKHFASDNYAGVHPEILSALLNANSGHESAYGGDIYTTRLQEVMQNNFGEDTVAYPVFNGTAANVLSLQTVMPRWGAVICTDTAHINVDEAGAPERVGGMKLLPVEGVHGKLTPDLAESKLRWLNDVHRVQPAVISISQTTELGTCYTAAEVRAIADFAHANELILHMDGSRLSNAAAFLNTNLSELTSAAGVDVLSLGATKNGALGVEAVLFFNKLLGTKEPSSFEYLRKINLQLASKMRFLSAQLIAMYEGDIWRNAAAQANTMAMRLRKGIEEIARAANDEIFITRPTESNAVFVAMRPEVANAALEHFSFYEWSSLENGLREYRLMCSFDTQIEDVDRLVKLLATSI